MAFWAELRRRKVVRVAAAYLVVAWIVMQVVNVAGPALNLPEWFDGAVFVLLAVGFAVALVMAWVFELTPEGVKVTAPAGAEAPSAPLSRTDIALAVAVVALLGVSAFQIARPRPVAAPAVRDALSIAVLPFLDLSPEGDQEYFSDGLSEELLNQLAQIDGLRVIARTSSFAFKGQDADVREIGATLGVAHLLEGSVRKSGDRLRITAQLIDAADGSHLWSQNYDRQLDDVFAIQDEIALAVADSLALTLGIGGNVEVAGGTENTEAYDLYLRGVSWGNQGGPEGLQRAVELFERAVAADPTFADAWIYLAGSKLRQLIFIEDGVEEQRAEVSAALDRALALAPASSLAYELRAELLAGGRNWTGAAQAIARAGDLGAPEARVCIEAEFASQLGRLSEALLQCRLDRRDTDPLSLDASTTLQRALDHAGRYSEAEVEYQRSLDLVGARGPVEHLALIRAWLDGDPARIDTQMRRFIAATLIPTEPLEAVLAAGGDTEAALAALRAAIADPANQEPLTQFVYASFLAHYGDAAAAAAGLRRSFARPGVPSEFLWTPHHTEVRREPEFKALMRELGLVDFWRETGEWNEFCRPVGADDLECF